MTDRTIHTAPDYPCERELRENVAGGQSLQRGDAHEDAIATGLRWGDDRSITAETLRNLLVEPMEGRPARAVVIRGVRVRGSLNLESDELGAPLIVDCCYFDEPVNVAGARGPAIALRSSRLPALVASELDLVGDLDLALSQVGVVVLNGAHTGGNLDLTGTQVRGGSYPVALGGGTLQANAPVGEPLRMAVLADGLRVDQHAFLRYGFEASGPVRLLGARIGVLDMSGAQLESHDAPALQADFARIDRSVICQDGFRAVGEMRLIGVHVGGQMDLSGAQLDAGDQADAALSLDGAEIDQGMFCGKGFSARGGVRLPGARIHSQLVLEGATLANPAGRALNGEGLRVDEGMYCTDGFTAHGSVFLSRARLGELDLRAATIVSNDRAALDATRLEVLQRVGGVGLTVIGETRLPGARLGQLDLAGARFCNRRGIALHADGIEVLGPVFMRTGPAGRARRFAAIGELRLIGARVAGQLNLAGAMLTAPSDVDRETGQIVVTAPAVSADGIRIDHDLFCGDGFSAHGEVRLLSGRIGGQLNLSGATITASPPRRAVDERKGACSPALSADDVLVERGVLARDGFSAEGEVRLPAAKLARLDLSSARLRNTSGCALSAHRLHVDDDVYCRDGFTADGEVHLRDAEVGGSLSFGDATLANAGGLALDLTGARIDGELRLRFTKRPAGEVSLTGARLGRLCDDEHTRSKVLRLVGCTYGGLPSESDDVLSRLRWLREADDYAPQPYTHLATVYREEGRERDARRVLFERERRRRPSLAPIGKVWNAFLEWTVGYGYRPWLAGVWLLVLVTLGSVAFAAGYASGNLVPRPVHPEFNAVIYTFDRLLPIVNLGQRDAFLARGAVQWLAFVYALAGWALTTAVVAGVTATVRRP